RRLPARSLRRPPPGSLRAPAAGPARRGHRAGSDRSGSGWRWERWWGCARTPPPGRAPRRPRPPAARVVVRVSSLSFRAAAPGGGILRVLVEVREHLGPHADLPRGGRGDGGDRLGPVEGTLQRQRGADQDVPGPSWDGQAEHGTLAHLAPGLQPALVQMRVLGGDRQPQSGAPDGAGPGRVRAPEPVEDPLRVLGGHAVAVILDDD